MKKKEEKFERRRLRKAVRNRRLLWLGVTVAVIMSIAALVQYWPKPPPSPPVVQEETFVGIQHAVVNENDTRLGTPQPGNVFASFSVRIMNCGYSGFPVAPSMFELEIDSVKYQASLDATSKLPTPLSQTTVADGQTVFGEVAYEIPAGSQIPDTPLVYTGGNFTINWTNAW